MRCKCGYYYSDILNKCPKCGIANSDNLDQITSYERQENQRLKFINNRSYASYLVNKFGAKVRPSLLAINDNWSAEKCRTELNINGGSNCL